MYIHNSLTQKRHQFSLAATINKNNSVNFTDIELKFAVVDTEVILNSLWVSSYLRSDNTIYTIISRKDIYKVLNIKWF